MSYNTVLQGLAAPGLGVAHDGVSAGGQAQALDEVIHCLLPPVLGAALTSRKPQLGCQR